MTRSSDHAEPSRPTAGEQPLEWIDAHRRPWRIEADRLGVALIGPRSRLDIPRKRFAADLYLSAVSDRVVVRFAGQEEEVGFLVSRSAAAEFLRRIGYDPAPRADPVEPMPDTVRHPSWPKMTATAVWALICASLAFIPFVGAAFAIAAVLLILAQRARSQPTAAMLHVRWLGRISTGLVIWGLAVWALSTWSWFHPLSGEPLPGGQVTFAQHDAAGELSKWTVGIVSLLVVLVSLSVHEAAHATSAWWCGDDLARSQGRVTLNPLAHIDPFGTVLLPAFLWWAGGPVFGYARPVPVRLEGIRRFRRAHILVSIAGPGSNLLLAALSLSLLLAVGSVMRHFVPAQTMAEFCDLSRPELQLTGLALAPVASVLLCGLKLFFLINLILAALNLIPIPPLDGSWVLEHLFPQSLGPLYARLRPFGFLVFILLIYSDVFQYLFIPAWIVLAVANVMLEFCIIG